MENPDNKKELDKIPDVDKKGEPIYKIDEYSKEADENPTFVNENPDASKDNEQDLKDEGSQE